ncbi:MAG: FkbM family methyltransferase [Planctomycetaceae bacterium]|jgi:FkbM family methyltransferase|nr:FkbM family methyltransferase [Planctomycetaceae bacterium]
MFKIAVRKITRLIAKPFWWVLKVFVASLLCNEGFRRSVYRYALRQKAKGRMSSFFGAENCYAKDWNDFFGKKTSLSMNQCLNRLLSGLDELSKESAMLLYDCRLMPASGAGIGIFNDVGDDLLPLFPLLQEEQNVLKTKENNYECPFILPKEADITHQVSDFGLCYLPDSVRASIRGRDIIDGGGCCGDSALSFSHYHPKNVYVFEPNPDSFSAMKEVIDANIGKIGGGGIVSVPLALSKDRCSLVLYSGGRFDGGATTDALAHRQNRYEVEAVSIDDYVREHSLDVGLIKLDVEGAESDVIDGALETIKSQKPVLLISIYHTPKDFFEIKPTLEQLGLGYHFMIRHIIYDNGFYEYVLLGWTES